MRKLASLLIALVAILSGCADDRGAVVREYDRVQYAGTAYGDIVFHQIHVTEYEHGRNEQIVYTSSLDVIEWRKSQFARAERFNERECSAGKQP